MKISLPKHPRIEHKKGNEATIVMEDLYPGYGLTLGNALRRILLASLPGTAIVSAKIKGMDHEFSTLPHVAEDGVELALNLKQVRLKLHGEEPQTLNILVKGQKEVTAKDIKTPSQVEIMNPEAHIATLTDKKAELEIELQVERGLGYVSVENKKSKKLEIGTIAFDAIFTPVRKVSYEVQDMRYADRTDYNRLLISIETDGSTTPEEAFRSAVKILQSQLINLEKFDSEIKESKDTEGKAKESEDLSKIKISDIDLSTRTVNVLTEVGIKTLGGLLKKDKESLEGVEGLGDKGMGEIERLFIKYNVDFK